MEGIKYMNLIEIVAVGIEIWGVENGDLVVPDHHRVSWYFSWK